MANENEAVQTKTNTNGSKPNKTDKNKSEPKPMVNIGSTLIPFEIAASKLGELFPDGISIVGLRITGGDVVADTEQEIK